MIETHVDIFLRLLEMNGRQTEWTANAITKGAKGVTILNLRSLHVRKLYCPRTKQTLQILKFYGRRSYYLHCIYPALDTIVVSKFFRNKQDFLAIVIVS